MFGILYTLFGLGAAGAGKIKQSIDDENARERSRQKGDPTYYGKNGETLVSNNRPVWTKTNKNGDRVIVDLFTGKEYINLTKETEKKKKEEAETKGNTVISITKKQWSKINNYYNSMWYKFRMFPDYKDINTDSYYTRLNINGLDFYMDINSGYIVRVADHENYKYRRGNVSIDNIIKVFNDNQDKLKLDEEYGKISRTMDMFYCKCGRYRFVDVSDDLRVIYTKWNNEEVVYE